MPMITLMSPGQRVAAFAVDGGRITIGGLVIDCAEHQSDEAVTLEVRGSANAPALGGDGQYLATVHIPARQYAAQEIAPDPVTGAPAIERIPLPLDPDAVELILWPIA